MGVWEQIKKGFKTFVIDYVKASPSLFMQHVWTQNNFDAAKSFLNRAKIFSLKSINKFLDFWRNLDSLNDFSFVKMWERSYGEVNPYIQDLEMRTKLKITDDNIQDVLNRWKSGIKIESLVNNNGLPPDEFSRRYKKYEMKNVDGSIEVTYDTNDTEYYGYPNEWDVSEVTDMSFLFKDENLYDLFTIPEVEFTQKMDKYSPRVIFVNWMWTGSTYGTMHDINDFVNHWSLSEGLKVEGMKGTWANNREVYDQASGKQGDAGANNEVYFGSSSSAGNWRGVHRELIIPTDKLGGAAGVILGIAVSYAIGSITKGMKGLAKYISTEAQATYRPIYTDDMRELVIRGNNRFPSGEGPIEGIESFDSNFTFDNDEGDFTDEDSDSVIAKQLRRRHLKVFNINNWDVSNVENIEGMFNNAVVNMPLDNWNLKKVKNAKNLFLEATFETKESLKGTRVISYTKNNGYGSEVFLYDVDQVRYTLENDDDKFTTTYDISNWELKQADLSGLFKSCNIVPDISSWTITNPQSLKDMFYNCQTFNQDIKNWDLDGTESLSQMFYNCKRFNNDITGWNVETVKNYFQMLSGVEDFKQNIFRWKVSSSSQVAFQKMLQDANLTRQKLMEYTDETMVDKSIGNQDWWFINENLTDSEVDRNNFTPYKFTTREDLNTALELSAVKDPDGLKKYGDISTWDVSNITDMSNLISQLDSRGAFIGNLSFWDVSNVTNMENMFNGAHNFNSDISNWDVSKVTNMKNMFKDAKKFNSNIRNKTITERKITVKTNNNNMYDSTISYNAWDVSNVTNMEGMFQGALSFNENISNWNVSKVTNMSKIFYGAKTFNQSLNSWDVSNVENMSYMFAAFENYSIVYDEIMEKDMIIYRDGVRTGSRNWNGTIWWDREFKENNLFNSDISSWDVSNVTNMEAMFQGAVEFNQSINNWDTKNVTTFKKMFYGAFKFNKPINNWNISNATDLSFMFHGAKEFNQSINNWDISNVNTFESMFTGLTLSNLYYNGFQTELSDQYFQFNRGVGVDKIYTVFNQDLPDWGNKLNGTNINMRNMFRGSNVFNGNIINWKTSNVQNMSDMFNGAKKFNQDISTKIINEGNEDEYTAWDIKNVQYMVRTISSCIDFNQDIRNWDVKTPNVNGLLHNTPSLSEDLFIPTLAKSAILNGETDNRWYFFKYKITDADLETRNITIDGNTIEIRTPKNDEIDPNALIGSWSFDNDITNMDGWFYNNSDIGQYEYIARWDVSNIQSMKYMFYNASNFSENISVWNTDNVVSTSTNPDPMEKMFYGATAMINRYIAITNSFNINDKDDYFTGLLVNNNTIRTIVNDWNTNRENSQYYEDIEVLNTELVTNMDELFKNITNIDIDIRNWDIKNVTSINNMFENATFSNSVNDKYLKYLQMEDSTISNLNNLPINKIYYIFKYPITQGSLRYKIGDLIYNNKIQEYGPLGNWNVNNITSLESALTNINFANNSIHEDISEWNVSKITNMSSLFYSTKNFNVEYIKDWNVENVKDMSNMFKACEFTIGDSLKDWNVENVEDMSHMFNQIYTPLQLNISGLSNWNTANLKDTSYMFVNDKQFNEDISNWTTTKLELMEGMFQDATSFNQNLNNWNVSKVTNTSFLFKGATNFNKNISSWNTENVIDMQSMFENATNFDQDISSWNTSNVQDMSYMFKNTPFNQNISNWDTSKVKTLRNTFNGCVFNKDISNWDVSNVTDMSYLFAYSSFNQSIANWNTSKVKNMSYMFINTPFNQSIANWNTSKVKNMSYMFESSNFRGDINTKEVTVNNNTYTAWDTSSVTNMKRMFNESNVFNQDISKWDVSNVTNMEWMFKRSFFCKDISDWDVSNVTNMNRMFNGGRFNKNIKSWNVESVTNFTGMFADNIRFIEDLREWNVDVNSIISGMFSDSTLMNILDERTVDIESNRNKYFSNKDATYYEYFDNKSKRNTFIFDGISDFELNYLRPIANDQFIYLQNDDLLAAKRTLINTTPITKELIENITNKELYEHLCNNFKLKLLHKDANNQIQSVDILPQEYNTDAQHFRPTSFIVFNDFIADSEVLQIASQNAWDSRNLYFQWFSNITNPKINTYTLQWKVDKLTTAYTFDYTNQSLIYKYKTMYGFNNVNIIESVDEKTIPKIYNCKLKIRLIPSDKDMDPVEQNYDIQNILNQDPTIINANSDGGLYQFFNREQEFTYKKTSILNDISIKYADDIKEVYTNAGWDTTHPLFSIEEEVEDIEFDVKGYTSTLDVVINNAINGSEEEMNDLLDFTETDILFLSSDRTIFNESRKVISTEANSLMFRLQNVIKSYNNVNIIDSELNNVDFEIFVNNSENIDNIIVELRKVAGDNVSKISDNKIHITSNINVNNEISLPTIFVFTKKDDDDDSDDELLDQLGPYKWYNERLCYSNDIWDIFPKKNEDSEGYSIMIDVNTNTIHKDRGYDYSNLENEVKNFINATNHLSTERRSNEKLLAEIKNILEPSSIVILYSLANLDDTDDNVNSMLNTDIIHNTYTLLWTLCDYIHTNKDDFSLTQIELYTIKEYLFDMNFSSIPDETYTTIAKIVCKTLDNITINKD